MSTRRYRLTPEIHQAICARVRKGVPAVAAALASGVPQEVFELWMHYGQVRRPVRKYRDLVEGVRQAEALVVCEALMRAAQERGEAVGNGRAGIIESAANLQATCREPVVNDDGSTTGRQAMRNRCTTDVGSTTPVG